MLVVVGLLKDLIPETFFLLLTKCWLLFHRVIWPGLGSLVSPVVLARACWLLLVSIVNQWFFCKVPTTKHARLHVEVLPVFAVKTAHVDQRPVNIVWFAVRITPVTCTRHDCPVKLVVVGPVLLCRLAEQVLRFQIFYRNLLDFFERLRALLNQLVLRARLVVVLFCSELERWPVSCDNPLFDRTIRSVKDWWLEGVLNSLLNSLMWLGLESGWVVCVCKSYFRLFQISFSTLLHNSVWKSGSTLKDIRVLVRCAGHFTRQRFLCKDQLMLVPCALELRLKVTALKRVWIPNVHLRRGCALRVLE